MKNTRFRIGTTNVQFSLPMIFILIIGAMTAVDLFYWDQSFGEMKLWEIITMFSMFVVLMLLDMVDMLVFPRRMPYAVQVLLFFLRLGAVVFVQILDVTGTALSLIGLIPYYTYFAFGGVVSVMFTLLILGYLYTEIDTYGADITLGVGNLLFMQILSFFTFHAHQVTLKNRGLLQDLHRANTDLQLVMDDIAELSVVEERMRLSRDLHDSAGHHLTAISIQLEKAVAYQDISEEDSMEAVLNARNSAKEALKEVRQFIGGLKENQDSFSFANKVELLFESMRVDGREIIWEISGDEMLYPLHVRRNLYHSLQELLTNAEKHAQAELISVGMKFGRREAILAVEDNGIGFNYRRALSRDGHFGLKHLRERTSNVDGVLQIRSQKGKGAKIEIRIPKER
ncbi:MAG: histidine kinase [Chloroflexota bacterium]